MNKNKGLKIFRLILMSIGGLMVAFTILSIVMGWGEPLDRIYWSQTRLCKEINHEWVKVEFFTQEEDISVCGFIESNNLNLQEQIDVRIYKGEIKSQIFAKYHDLIWVTNGDVVLPINKELKAGTYVISINLGRKILDVIELKIIE